MLVVLLPTYQLVSFVIVSLAMVLVTHLIITAIGFWFVETIVQM